MYRHNAGTDNSPTYDEIKLTEVKAIYDTPVEKEAIELRSNTAYASRPEMIDIQNNTAYASRPEMIDIQNNTAYASRPEMIDIQNNTAYGQI